jgi:uncharacterized protein (DUF1501 family)
MKRRDFVKALPIGVAALGVPFSIGGLAGRAFGRSGPLDSILNAQDETDRVLVLINLAGGNDGLNTVIPFQDSAYQNARKTIGFGSADIPSLYPYLLSSQSITRNDLALNPAMGTVPSGATYASFYDMFKAGKVAIVNNVGYPNPNLSHFRSTDIWNTASDSNIVLSSGWMGRWLENVYTGYPGNVQTGDDPLAITFGGASSPVFQGDTSGMGIAISDPPSYATTGAAATEEIPNTNAGAELSFIRSIYTQSDVYNQTFTSHFPKGSKSPTLVAYPTSRIAAQMKNVAWCIQAGLKTRVYFVTLSGFDTHFGQNSKDPTVNGQGQLLMQLAQAIAAFQADIEAAGIADRVIGMTYSVFGRRVIENGSLGTDHGTCAPQFVFGSQINGEVYSTHPDLTNLNTNGDLQWKIDFRQLYTSVLGDWFGASDTIRNSVLMNKSFGTQLGVNSASTSQGLIKTPASGVSVPDQPTQYFELRANYPNPFHDRTTIAFALSRTMPVTLEIFDERGTKVTTLASETMPRGTYEIPFAATALSNGTYIARLEAAGQVQIRQMTLAK